MFCPGCGSQESQFTQFCRACGANLRSVRAGLEKPGAAPATTAREEIGRAVADKIRELQTAQDLKKVAEEILPEVEKFLETPREKRLRRLRAGVITAAAGIGATLFFVILTQKEADAQFLVAMGLTLFFIGLGIIVNGLLFTVTRESKPEQILAESVQDFLARPAEGSTGRLEAKPSAPELNAPFSVTEQTTRHLPEGQGRT